MMWELWTEYVVDNPRLFKAAELIDRGNISQQIQPERPYPGIQNSRSNALDMI